jgi:hypothetical protein
MLVAGSLGALTMLIGLSLTGMVGSSATDTATRSTLRAAEIASTPSDQSAYTVQISNAGTTRTFPAILADRSGHLVLCATIDSHATVTVTHAAEAWSNPAVVGFDTETAATVLEVKGLIGAKPTATASANLGDQVWATRSWPSASAATPATVVALNTTSRTRTGAHHGLLTALTTTSTSADAYLRDKEGRVLGLVSAADQQPEDSLALVLPARAALRVAKQMEQRGDAAPPRLPAEIAEVPTAPGVQRVEIASIPGPQEQSPLRVNDRVLSIRGVPTHTLDDVEGALLVEEPGTQVPVAIERDGTRTVISVTLASMAPFP